MYLLGGRDREARLALFGFEAEVDLGASGVRPRGGASTTAFRDIRVRAPIAFAARLAADAESPFAVYFDTGYSAFEGMFEVSGPLEATVERWTRTHVVTRMPLSESGTLTVATPCADVRWGAPIESDEARPSSAQSDTGITLHGDVAFRMSASPSSPVLFHVRSGDELLPGEIVATASRFALVRIHDDFVALEGWVRSSSVRSAPEQTSPAMGGSNLRGSSIGPIPFEVDVSVTWLDVWLAPGTAVYDHDEATQPIGHISERLRVLLLHRPGARRAALHSLTRDSGPCERMRGATRARCEEIAVREDTSLIRLSDEARDADSTGAYGRHFFFVDEPGAATIATP